MINGSVGEHIYIKAEYVVSHQLSKQQANVDTATTIHSYTPETGMKRRSECAFHNMDALSCPRVRL